MKIFTRISAFIFFGIFYGAACFQAPAQSVKTVPVIVELFTSEGCSTCPPVDKYLQKLVQEQPVSGAEIIALSEHVDYWNRDGWTDKFSSAQFSNRQKYYAAFFKRTELFTPQLVADGKLEITTKDGNKTLLESLKEPKADVALKTESKNENGVSLKISVANLPQIASGDKAVMVIAVTENNLSTDVSGGENSGRTLKHTAVVRYLKSLGEIQNGAADFSADIVLEKNWKRENLSLVAFVQEVGGRRILGAAKINLSN